MKKSSFPYRQHSVFPSSAVILTACQVLLSLCETVGHRLRQDQVLCNCICVELKDFNFRVQSHQAMLEIATDSTTLLCENACRLPSEEGSRWSI